MMFYQRRVDTAFNIRVGPAGLRIPTVERDISLLKKSGPPLCLSQPPIQQVPDVKRSGREVDHSLPCSAEVKNEWI